MQQCRPRRWWWVDCEFKQTLSVSKHQVDGYVVVTFSSKAYTMKPVRSSTGALRLEEVAGGPMLMVQIPAKSMLMDTARGRRIVDACIHEEQAKEASTPNSLGMNLPGQVNTASRSPGTALLIGRRISAAPRWQQPGMLCA
jgi:hypothetical protein